MRNVVLPIRQGGQLEPTKGLARRAAWARRARAASPAQGRHFSISWSDVSTSLIKQSPCIDHAMIQVSRHGKQKTHCPCFACRGPRPRSAAAASRQPSRRSPLRPWSVRKKKSFNSFSLLERLLSPTTSRAASKTT